MRYQKIKGYKYRLVSDESILLPWLKGIDFDSEYIRITPDGTLTGKKYYAWNGASGPAIDTQSSLRGSMFHDVLYQLIRIGVLAKALYKPLADALLRYICIEDGMWQWRAELWYLAVHNFGSIWGFRDDGQDEIYEVNNGNLA